MKLVVDFGPIHGNTYTLATALAASRIPITTMEQLVRQVAEWRASLLDKGLRAIAGKSKVMVAVVGR